MPSEHFLKITLKQDRNKSGSWEITESQNHQGWNRPSSPTINPKSPLHHIPRWYIQMSLEHFQKWWFHHLPEQLSSMLNHSLSIPSQPPLTKLKVISSQTFNWDTAEEIGLHCTITSFQINNLCLSRLNNPSSLSCSGQTQKFSDSGFPGHNHWIFWSKESIQEFAPLLF